MWRLIEFDSEEQQSYSDKENNVLIEQIVEGVVYGEAGFRSYC